MGHPRALPESSSFSKFRHEAEMPHLSLHLRALMVMNPPASVIDSIMAPQAQQTSRCVNLADEGFSRLEPEQHAFSCEDASAFTLPHFRISLPGARCFAPCAEPRSCAAKPELVFQTSGARARSYEDCPFRTRCNSDNLAYLRESARILLQLLYHLLLIYPLLNPHSTLCCIAGQESGLARFDRFERSRARTHSAFKVFSVSG